MKRPRAIIYCDDTDAVPAEALPILVGADVNKKTLLQALGETCAFPEHYALNWDAAWDCLHDVDINHLLLDLRHAEKIDQRDFKGFSSLIIDAFDAWQQPQLWVVGKTRNK